VLISLLFYPNWYYRRSQFEQFVVNSSNMATTEIEMSSLSIIVDDLFISSKLQSGRADEGGVENFRPLSVFHTHDLTRLNVPIAEGTYPLSETTLGDDEFLR
jgi:hypothetical protein